MPKTSTMQKALHNFAFSSNKPKGVQLRKLKRFMNIGNKTEKRSKKDKQNYVSHGLNIHRAILRKYSK